MKINLNLSADTVAKVALSIWFISLWLPGLVLYRELKSVFGISILLSGWASPASVFFSKVSPSLAWFANLFFLLSVSRILNNKPTRSAPILAVLFSVDAFRVESLSMNENGGSSLVFGYGWGFSLWLVSMSLILVSAGIRKSEADLGYSEGWNGTKALGWLLTFAFAVINICFPIYDRIIANSYERERLAAVAFKAGKVCSQDTAEVSNYFNGFSGIVEVVLLDKPDSAESYFMNAETLLSWGIPVVRFKDVDYSLKISGQRAVIYSVAASGKPDAILYFSNKNKDFINIRMQDVRRGLEFFNQSWVREKLNYFCPDYESISVPPGRPPRSLVLKALGIADGDLLREKIAKQYYEMGKSVNGVVIKHKHEPVTVSSSGVGERKLSLSSGVTANCPDGSHLDVSGQKNSAGIGRYGRFSQNGKTYYFQSVGGESAYCDGNAIYIYHINSDGMNFYLRVRQYDFFNFQLVMDLSMFASIEGNMIERKSFVESISREEESIVIMLKGVDTGERWSMAAPLATFTMAD